jgi:hypothetical protein
MGERTNIVRGPEAAIEESAECEPRQQTFLSSDSSASASVSSIKQATLSRTDDVIFEYTCDIPSSATGGRTSAPAATSATFTYNECKNCSSKCSESLAGELVMVKLGKLQMTHPTGNDRV